MSCCWRPVAHRLPSGRRGVTLDGNGLIPIGDHESIRYSGPTAETFYLVGWGTEHERLFPASAAKEAVVYRNSVDRTLAIDPVSSTQLPASAVAEALAG